MKTKKQKQCKKEKKLLKTLKGKSDKKNHKALRKLNDAFKINAKGAEAKSNKYNGMTRKAKKKFQSLPLRERMLLKLKSSRFRYINEEFYSMKGSDALQYFKNDPSAFKAYHDGYENQVKQWPIDPLDKIIDDLKTCNAESVIADFGCGTARLAKAIDKCKVHSFDLVALDPLTTVCDMASTPLPSESVDFVVCCLSLMGTNFADYVKEANRILKVGGILKIAEVESRFENVDEFQLALAKFGFKVIKSDLAHRIFYFFDLVKQDKIGKKANKKLPELTLKPCLYKKR